MKLWFFIGDTIEWLCTHDSVSGVPRVTLELLSAALAGENEKSFEIVTCVLGQTKSDLVAVDKDAARVFFASKTGNIPTTRSGAPRGEWDKPGDIGHRRSKRDASAIPVAATRSPEVGDHVLFTGVIWNPLYANLFQKLNEAGIDFSLIVYDIIPVDSPEFVSESYRERFVEWLRAAVTYAKFVFVSSSLTIDKILRWGVASGTEIKANIVQIRFGSTTLTALPAPSWLERIRLMRKLGLRSFVLSVGTIDRRKNQALLCHIWVQLLKDFRKSEVPRLVLVGREDTKVAKFGPAIAHAVKAKQIMILQGVSDNELARLYRSCLFTVFPSLCEGYGLPVAESLSFGKLCLSADLPVIREHAGEFAWYFDPKNEAAAYACVRNALETPDLALMAEKRIRRDYRATAWVETFSEMAGAIAG